MPAEPVNSVDFYDLIVIGCGPAGEKGAAQAAYFGKRVLVIEKEQEVGGAVANTGTLPSKTLRETALYLSGFRQRGLYGVEMRLDHQVGVQDLLYRERAVSAWDRRRIRQNLEAHGVALLQGTARFLDPHTLAVKLPDGAERRVRGEVFLVATGSHPHRPGLYPFDAPNIYDSDKILQLTGIPGSLAVVGGGVIGCEYACTFAALGIPVTLIDGRAPLLPFLDRQIGELLFERMAVLGVDFLVPESVTSVEPLDDRVRLRLASGESCEAHAVLVAAGRDANSRELGLEALGVKLNPRGHIQVNEHYQTAVANIYAAGDVIGFPALASTSMEQARVAMVHAFKLQGEEALASVLPYALYTIPELGMAGETEESLREKKVDYVAGHAFYAHNPRGQIIGDGGGLLKLLFRREDLRLVGVHVLGEQASELVHVGLQGLLMGVQAELFIRTCYNFPSLSDAYKYATYNALGHLRASTGQGLKPV